MHSAAVGQQCPDCVQEGVRSVQTAQTRLGGRIAPPRPVLTYLLIAVNAVMFVLQKTSPHIQSDLVLWVPGVAEGQWYRLVTSAFLHYGLAHIVFNMWALYVVGPQLEHWLGRLRFGVLYALSGLGGSVLVYLLASVNSATAGASGAIFGLFGATFVLFRRLQLDVRGIGLIIAINLVITFMPSVVGVPAISWQGHIGGLITGTLVAAVFAYAPTPQRKLALISVSVVLMAVFVGLTLWRTHELQAAFGWSVAG
jgi:membrane associated rhomboid family serine protease